MRFLILLFMGLSFPLYGTPTSLFWTNCNTDVLTTGYANIDVDNYFTVFNRRGENPFFSPSIGIQFGVFCWKDWRVEAGVDYNGGTDHPLLFNAKIGIKEDKLFRHSPAFNVGVFDVGTHFRGRNRTNFNVIDVIFGKSLPKKIGGRVFVAGYSGTRALGKVRQGVMVGFLYPFFPCTDCYGKKFNKFLIAADYASGKNIIGGGGVALWYYFNSFVNIETGPVWFNDADLNGHWKVGVQVNITFPAWCARCDK